MDGLVNCAGIVNLTAFGEVQEDEMDRHLEVNVKAMVNVSQEITNKMIEAGTKGAVVNISSQSAQRAVHLHLSYCASKGKRSIDSS